MNNTDTEIFNTALTRLTETLEIDFHVEHLDHEEIIDARIKLHLGDMPVELYVEIKGEARTTVMHQILNFRSQFGGDWVLISRYIPQPLKKQLKNEGINYIESTGNCYINAKGIIIYVNDKPVTKSRASSAGRLWKTAGLKFLFAMFCDPDLLNQTYRTIASQANLALGTVGPLMDELLKQGYIKEYKKDGQPIMVLESKEQLVQRWAEVYNAVLKPKLHMGNFRFMGGNQELNWKEMQTIYFKWGGENAGALLTNYLHPETYTMYTGVPKATLMKDLKLIPDVNGKIEVYEQFWSKELILKPDNEFTVPPLLAFAELITSLDSRNRETAERIKDKYLG